MAWLSHTTVWEWKCQSYSLLTQYIAEILHVNYLKLEGNVLLCIYSVCLHVPSMYTHSISEGVWIRGHNVNDWLSARCCHHLHCVYNLPLLSSPVICWGSIKCQALWGDTPDHRTNTETKHKVAVSVVVCWPYLHRPQLHSHHHHCRLTKMMMITLLQCSPHEKVTSLVPGHSIGKCCHNWCREYYVRLNHWWTHKATIILSFVKFHEKDFSANKCVSMYLCSSWLHCSTHPWLNLVLKKLFI